MSSKKRGSKIREFRKNIILTYDNNYLGAKIWRIFRKVPKFYSIVKLFKVKTGISSSIYSIVKLFKVKTAISSSIYYINVTKK